MTKPPIGRISMTGRTQDRNDRLQIRLYQSSDLEPVLRLWREARLQAFPELETRMAHTPQDDRAHFRNVLLAQCEVWVAEKDSEVAGFLARRGQLVDQLFVRIDHQRQGIGTVLLDKAREQSPDRLHLYAFQSNRSACAFYERRGFKAVCYGVSPPPESEPDVEYEWQTDQITAVTT